MIHLSYDTGVIIAVKKTKLTRGEIIDILFSDEEEHKCFVCEEEFCRSIIDYKQYKVLNDKIVIFCDQCIKLHEICCICEQILPSINMISLYNDSYCRDCFKKHSIKCSRCGNDVIKKYASQDIFELGRVICRKCLDEELYERAKQLHGHPTLY